MIDYELVLADGQHETMVEVFVGIPEVWGLYDVRTDGELTGRWHWRPSLGLGQSPYFDDVSFGHLPYEEWSP